MIDTKETPSQTAGPYVHIGCLPEIAGLERRQLGSGFGAILSDAADAIDLEITVFDGAGEPVRDAMVEIWQAGPDGRFDSKGFQNWGRAATDLDSVLYRFRTLKPAALDGQAPHILVWIVARGINLGLTTRIYFPEDDHGTDPVMTLAGDRAATLVAQATPSGYRHVIHLQGSEETVFFDV